MARQITIAFAENGNRDSIPVTVQLNGEVSWAEGYGFDYQRPIGSSPLAKNVERTKQNALFHDITEVLRQYQQQGAPEWYANTPYAQFARVKHGGNYYVALVDATEQEPGTGGDWTVDNVAAQARQNNLTATTDPTVNDDETAGYEPLSQWINTSSGEIFVAISVTAGAANWQPGTLSIDELGNVALLDANAIGQAIIQSPNPSAIRFLRANADNSVSWLSASDYRTALGLGAAAVASITSSSIDTTTGALTKTGDAGWLGLNPTTETDANNIVIAANYQLTTGTPASFSNFPSWAEPSRSTLLVMGNMSPYGMQMYFDRTLGRSAYRVYNGSFGAWREFWTDANLVKTTSATDTTAGSMLKVGDGGILVPITITGQNLNLRRPTGFYYAQAPASGPAGTSSGWVLQQDISAAYNTQTFVDAVTGNYYHRTLSNSVQGLWRMVWDTGNTSANVQTMLGSADNAAIRSNTDTAQLGVEPIVTTDSTNRTVFSEAKGQYTVLTTDTASPLLNLTVAANSSIPLGAVFKYLNSGIASTVWEVAPEVGISTNVPPGGSLFFGQNQEIEVRKIAASTYRISGQTMTLDQQVLSPIGGVGDGSATLQRFRKPDGTGFVVATGTINRSYTGATNCFAVPSGFLAIDDALVYGVGTTKGATFSGSTLPSAVYFDGNIQIRDATGAGKIDFSVTWPLDPNQ